MFEVFLYFLNLKNLHRMRDDQPDYTEKLMDKDKWQKATDYSAAKLKLSIIQEFAGFLIFIVTIFFLSLMSLVIGMQLPTMEYLSLLLYA